MSRPNASENRDRSSRDGPWRVPKAAIGLILTVAITLVVTQVYADFRHDREVLKPVVVTVETNPAHIPAFSDMGQSVIFSPKRVVRGSPGEGCEGFHDWAHRQGGIDAHNTMAQVAVQGKSSGAVVITAVRVVITKKTKTRSGMAVGCPSAGDNDARLLEVDLDRGAVRGFRRKDGGGVVYTLQTGESEVFDVIATAKNATYAWNLAFELVSEGRRQTVYVGASSTRPFTTTSRSRHKAGWDWNFGEGLWSWTGSRPTRRRVSDGPLVPPVARR